MVYLKINSLIFEMIQVADMDISSIACHRLCSKQIISFQQFQSVISQLQLKISQTEKQMKQ